MCPHFEVAGKLLQLSNLSHQASLHRASGQVHNTYRSLILCKLAQERKAKCGEMSTVCYSAVEHPGSKGRR